MSTAAELRQLLKTDGNGKDLYEHLTEVIMIFHAFNLFILFILLPVYDMKGSNENSDRTTKECLRCL